MSIDRHCVNNETRFPFIVEVAGAFSFLSSPAPLFPRLKHLQNMLIPRMRQGSVRGASTQMLFYFFVIYCFYVVIFSRQTRQPIFQHYTHARTRARARAVFPVFILTLYFEFLKKCPDGADAPSHSADVGLTQWPFWSDAGLAAG